MERRLALYAYANDWEKNDLICELMNLLWTEEEQGAKFPVFREFELFLNNTPDKRGHFVHQFEVYLLGLNLLICLVKSNEDAKKFGLTNKEDVYKTWLMTATVHDFGYPIERASKIVTQLALLYKNLDMVSLSKNYTSITDEISKNNAELGELVLTKRPLYKINIDEIILKLIQETLSLEEAYAIPLFKEFKKKNTHGYVSAIILFRTMFKALWKDKSLVDVEKLSIYKMVSTAMGSIAVHDLRNDQENYIRSIDFSVNPFAYLLFIIDNIQDWSRTNTPTEDWPVYNLLNFSIEGNNIKIEHVLSHTAWTDKIRKNVAQSLENKKRLLSLPVPPSPPFDCNVKLLFFGNDDSMFDPIIIPI